MEAGAIFTMTSARPSRDPALTGPHDARTAAATPVDWQSRAVPAAQAVRS